MPALLVGKSIVQIRDNNMKNDLCGYNDLALNMTRLPPTKVRE
jgi:hypothetical protein